MKRDWIKQWSSWLDREMHVQVYGEDWGVPVVVFPCQDSMADNWENFQMIDTIGDYLESGAIQLYCVDTVDKDSWSAVWNWDKGYRADIQERYYRYITDEVLPLISSVNHSGKMPLATGFSLGATHAAIMALRRPDLFGGCIALSGCYDATYFFDGWCNETLYNNSPVHFISNMPEDHHYIDLYNQRRIIICVGQGKWEDEGRRTTAWLRDSFNAKGIKAWVDFWGFDVDHDWPWWRIQFNYFLPKVLENY